MKKKSEKLQNSTGSKSTAQHPLTGDGWIRVDATALILGHLWKKNFSFNHPIFKKRLMRNQNNSYSLVHINLRKRPKSIVKNYLPLGYILYEATTSSWVTFSYELTGLA
jgi:hypothetical protein